jgi:uncharacterized protein YkwD
MLLSHHLVLHQTYTAATALSLQSFSCSHMLLTMRPLSVLPLALPLLVVSSPTPQPAGNAAYSNSTLFRADVLNATDTFRTQYNASSIQWNDTLAEFAEEVVQDCKFEHSVRLPLELRE